MSFVVPATNARNTGLDNNARLEKRTMEQPDMEDGIRRAVMATLNGLGVDAFHAASWFPSSEKYGVFANAE